MSAGFDLRGYQREVIINAEIAAIATAFMANAVQQGQRALFLAHRRELITQASPKLHTVGVDAGIILPGYPMHLAEPVGRRKRYSYASLVAYRDRGLAGTQTRAAERAARGERRPPPPNLRGRTRQPGSDT